VLACELNFIVGINVEEKIIVYVGFGTACGHSIPYGFWNISPWVRRMTVFPDISGELWEQETQVTGYLGEVISSQL
jgi:hypothetical protein